MALTSPEILIHSAWQAECIYWCFAELEFDRAGEGIYCTEKGEWYGCFCDSGCLCLQFRELSGKKHAINREGKSIKREILKKSASNRKYNLLAFYRNLR